MKLYNFFRSGTSHRLRIALNLKGLTYEYLPVDLRSEQHVGAEYKALNPQALVPTLLVDGHVMTQSPAIIEWLEERYPDPALLPSDPDARARVSGSRLDGHRDGPQGRGGRQRRRRGCRGNRRTGHRVVVVVATEREEEDQGAR